MPSYPPHLFRFLNPLPTNVRRLTFNIHVYKIENKVKIWRESIPRRVYDCLRDPIHKQPARNARPSPSMRDLVNLPQNAAAHASHHRCAHSAAGVRGVAVVQGCPTCGEDRLLLQANKQALNKKFKLLSLWTYSNRYFSAVLHSGAQTGR